MNEQSKAQQVQSQLQVNIQNDLEAAKKMKSGIDKAIVEKHMLSTNTEFIME